MDSKRKTHSEKNRTIAPIAPTCSLAWLGRHSTASVSHNLPPAIIHVQLARWLLSCVIEIREDTWLLYNIGILVTVGITTIENVVIMSD